MAENSGETQQFKKRLAVRRIQSYLDQAVASLQVLPKSGYRNTLEGIPRAVAENVASLG